MVANKWFKLLAVVLISMAGSYYAEAQNTIVISKEKLRLSVINENKDTLCSMPCALGRNYGQKVSRGDRRTPEGMFPIQSIENSTGWIYISDDGKRKSRGVYGPWFIRIKSEFTSQIGIHGTSAPRSIGTRCSKGCIRLRNDDVRKLVTYVKQGDLVIIHPDPKKKK